MIPAFQFEERLVFPHIVVLVKVVGCQRQADRPRGEILQRAPDARHHQQPLIGTVERVGILIGAVIDCNVKAATDGNDELVAGVMAVAAALGAARHIIYIKCALDVKRQVHAIVHRRQIAVGMVVAVQGDDAAIVDMSAVVNLDSILTIHRFLSLIL